MLFTSIMNLAIAQLWYTPWEVGPGFLNKAQLRLKEIQHQQCMQNIKQLKYQVRSCFKLNTQSRSLEYNIQKEARMSKNDKLDEIIKALNMKFYTFLTKMAMKWWWRAAASLTHHGGERLLKIAMVLTKISMTLRQNDDYEVAGKRNYDDIMMLRQWMG